MNNKYKKIIALLMAAVLLTGVCYAADFKEALKPVAEGIESFLLPIIFIVGAFGAIYCVSLGVKLGKAEEPQDREKAKNNLKSAVIGFVIIFLLIVGLKLFLPALIKWMDGATIFP